MKKHSFVFPLLFVGLLLGLPALLGCSSSDDSPPPKSTNEKLDSPDAKERLEGANEAEKKWGAGP